LLFPCGLFGAGLVTCTGLFWSPGLKSLLFPSGLSGVEGFGFAAAPAAGLEAGLEAGLL
jgi:hypothetical protein